LKVMTTRVTTNPVLSPGIIHQPTADTVDGRDEGVKGRRKGWTSGIGRRQGKPPPYPHSLGGRCQGRIVGRRPCRKPASRAATRSLSASARARASPRPRGRRRSFFSCICRPRAHRLRRRRREPIRSSPPAPCRPSAGPSTHLRAYAPSQPRPGEPLAVLVRPDDEFSNLSHEPPGDVSVLADGQELPGRAEQVDRSTCVRVHVRPPAEGV